MFYVEPFTYRYMFSLSCFDQKYGKASPNKKKIIFLIFFKKGIDNKSSVWYNIKVVRTWPIGQAVKTLASHAGNSGSIPGWVTKRNKSELFRKSKLVRICFLL